MVAHNPAKVPITNFKTWLCKAVFSGAASVSDMISPSLSGRSTFAVEGYLTLSGILGKSSLGAAERQLLLLTISAANGCDYCVAAYTMGGRGAGLDEAVIEAIRNGKPVPGPR
jgi:AhpD family alkylhydroperoxidase